MKTIKIDKELLLVEVPKDARNFTLIESHTYFKSPRIEHSTGGFDLDRKFDYKIIGLIETPNVDFDFEVQESWVRNIGNSTFIFGDAYENYLNEEEMFENIKDSFRTRIQKTIQDNGLYLMNPLGLFDEFDKQIFNHSTGRLKLWQEAEEKTIKGKLLLIKKSLEYGR